MSRADASSFSIHSSERAARIEIGYTLRASACLPHHHHHQQLMEPIHRASWDGDVEKVQRLVEEDGRRLNARIQGDEAIELDGWNARGRTPLMLAASRKGTTRWWRGCWPWGWTRA